MTPRPSYSWAWTLIFFLGTWCIRRRQAWRFRCWEMQRSFHGRWVGTSSTRTWRCFRSQQRTCVTPWHARGCHVSRKSEESASCRDQVCLPLGQRAGLKPLKCRTREGEAWWPDRRTCSRLLASFGATEDCMDWADWEDRESRFTHCFTLDQRSKASIQCGLILMCWALLKNGAAWLVISYYLRHKDSIWHLQLTTGTWTPGRRVSFWNASFSGSTLDSGGLRWFQGKLQNWTHIGSGSIHAHISNVVPLPHCSSAIFVLREWSDHCAREGLVRRCNMISKKHMNNAKNDGLSDCPLFVTFLEHLRVILPRRTSHRIPAG